MYMQAYIQTNKPTRAFQGLHLRGFFSAKMEFTGDRHVDKNSLSLFTYSKFYCILFKDTSVKSIKIRYKLACMRIYYLLTHTSFK